MAVSKLGKVIREMRESRKLSQDELAAELGVKRNSVWNVENGKTQTFKTPGVLRALQEKFGIDAAALSGGNVTTLTAADDSDAGMVWVDFYDRVPASQKEWVPENPEKRVRVPAELKPSFVVVCRGDCMDPAIANGQKVVGSQTEWENDGQKFIVGQDYVVCMADGRVTLKRAARDSQGRKGWFRLEPVNPKFSAESWDEDGQNVLWAAKVTAVLRR